MPHGVALISCRQTQLAVGCAVTLTCTTVRRSWAMKRASSILDRQWTDSPCGTREMLFSHDLSVTRDNKTDLGGAGRSAPSSRIKNTEDELASYDPRIELLLDRILDEYGLVVCGWSAEWDTGLRAAMERAKNRRYTTYWASRGEPGATATDLIARRQAVPIPIRDADQFFEDLADRVAAVQESGDDPESVAVALAQLKRYLARRRDRIRYADLMRGATEELVRATSDDHFPLSVGRVTVSDIAGRVRRYAQIADRVTQLVASAAYWGEEAHVPELTVLLRRLAEAPLGRSGQTMSPNAALYPALLAMYAAGVAMVARHEYSRLSAVLTLDVNTGHERRPLLEALSPDGVLADGIAKELRGDGRRWRTPASDELHEALRKPFSDLIPSDEEYAGIFDRFEYLLSLAEADWWITIGQWARFSGGRFAWRRGPGSPGGLPSIVAAELERDGAVWPPLSAGMFGGEIARLQAAKPESTDRSLTGRAAGLAESSAGVAALAGRCRGRTGARSRRSARLGGVEGAGARVREACAGMLARGLEPARRCERASGRER